jgi:hypothetical protein
MPQAQDGEISIRVDRDDETDFKGDGLDRQAQHAHGKPSPTGS